jgi:uncharacterized membrane protein YjjP (DUF1212 family)
MGVDNSGQRTSQYNIQINEAELLEGLREIGRAMIASGVSVGVVTNTLTEISQLYGKACEIIVLPNMIFLKLGLSSHGKIDFAVHSLSTLRLNQVSDLSETIDRVRNKQLPLSEVPQRIKVILKKEPRFKPALEILGYFLSCIGLTLLYRPELRALITTGAMGILAGLMLLWFGKRPRFNLLLPIIVAIVISTLVFLLTRLGFIYGPANLIITPLITFLPGSMLTTGMIELASRNIISGSARLIYGVAVLVLLGAGIAVGLNISGLPAHQVSAYEAVYFPWWAPILGTLLFGIGSFVRLSGENRDLRWMLIVLYLAMIGQSIGEFFLDSNLGAFLGALLMTLSSEFIARSPRRTPAVVAQSLAFWFLVPGARGLLSVTSILSDNLQRATIGLGQVIVLIIMITLGVLFGTLIIAPKKLIPIEDIAEEP